MRRTLVKGTALAAALLLGAATFSAPAEAGRRYYRHNGAGIIAGLALGAIIGGAVARRDYYYGPYDYYYGPYAPPPAAYYPPPPPPAYYPPAPAYAYAPPPWTPDWYAYCASKYRSFDPRSGTYQPYGGPRRLCQ